MNKNLESCGPYRPCVGIMLYNSEGKVFTGKRIDYNSSAWQMPQGGIEPGEVAKKAAIRELFEETNISEDYIEFVHQIDEWLFYDIPRDMVSKFWNGKFKGQKQKWFLFKFVGSDVDVNIVTKNPEFSAWKWTSLESLVEEIVPFKKEIYKIVLEKFKQYLI